MRKLLPVVRHRLPCPLPRSLGPCFCVSIKKQWWDLQDFESPPTIVPLIQGFAHELPSHPVYHLGLNEKSSLWWAPLGKLIAIKPLLEKFTEATFWARKVTKMKHQNVTGKHNSAKGSSQNLLPVQTSQAHLVTIQAPLPEIVFLFTCILPWYLKGFWWWNPKFAETPRNSTERLCRIPPTDQPSFKPFTKRIRDVDRAKLVESKPQSCAKVVGCGVTLKRCQQCRWSHSDVHG